MNIKKYKLGELFCGPGGIALGALNAEAAKGNKGTEKAQRKAEPQPDGARVGSPAKQQSPGASKKESKHESPAQPQGKAGGAKGKGKKPNAHWGLLKEAIENYTDYRALEEEHTTAFTENVVFAGS